MPVKPESTPISIRHRLGDRRALPRGQLLYWIVATATTDSDSYNWDDVDIFVKRATPTSTYSVSSLMPDPPSNVYRDQLSSLALGIALWDPHPPKEFYERVSIGDVGYLHPSEGTFIRLFNVMLSWDDPLNHRLGVPEAYEPLDCGPFANTLKRQFDSIDHYSRSVSADTNADNMQAMRPDE